LIFAALVGVASAGANLGNDFLRPRPVTIGVDCPANATSVRFQFPEATAPGSETACLWRGGNNTVLCILDDGLHRGSDINGVTANGRCQNVPTKRSIDEAEERRAELDVFVPLTWIRRDEKFNEKQTSCAPEFRLLIDGEVVAHTESSATDDQHYPRDGEAEFKVKVSLTKERNHRFQVQYRDGEGCDEFDDDDDVEKRTFVDIESLSRDDPPCKAHNKRSVEDVESSSSSSGTTVDASIRERARFNCVALNEAILVRLSSDDDDDSSSSSSSSSSSD
jgi:hypothetical protein